MITSHCVELLTINYHSSIIRIMFCIECGVVLGPTNKFCGSCGAPVCVKRKVTKEPDTAKPGPSKSFDESAKGCFSPNGSPSLHKKREEVQSKLDFLKAKFLDSKKKMSSKRLGGHTKSSGLEILEVRFLDNRGKRLQRVINGSSSLLLEVESSSAVPEWMALLSAKFKTQIPMEAMVFKEHKFIALKDTTSVEDLKNLSKGKRKHFGFFVQVHA
ncbi:uncharacterized protein LOC133190032 isoform X1 [Saccostrea echinata]|uniref:uncharacterized protein LOC133190032 isoform X1 n=2 Tax=Saccostrea echinata TaxID=191078 RepID=UPI002A7FE0F4|nr:uncharacterized protein LOC133190032 isoform X1 [Saccostrea echinata]